MPGAVDLPGPRPRVEVGSAGWLDHLGDNHMRILGSAEERELHSNGPHLRSHRSVTRTRKQKRPRSIAGQGRSGDTEQKESRT